MVEKIESTKNTSSQLKFLIAEDDTVSRNVIKAILGQLGEVDITDNGKEALTMFELNIDCGALPYDLVCLDISMPVMDGLQALQKIRDFEDSKKMETTKVLMTTAFSDKQFILDAFKHGKLGSVSYILKPFSSADLYNELKKLRIISPEKFQELVAA